MRYNYYCTIIQMLLLSVAILLSKQLILMLVIGFFYSVSHDVLQLDSIKTVPLRRSLVDNLTHIIIGVFSWLLCISYEKLCHPWNIANCLLCGFFASIVDIDHFLMAKSLKLNVSVIFLRQYFHVIFLLFVVINGTCL